MSVMCVYFLNFFLAGLDDEEEWDETHENEDENEPSVNKTVRHRGLDWAADVLPEFPAPTFPSQPQETLP